MTCKDCACNDLCKDMVNFGIVDLPYEDETPCKHFINKADVVPVVRCKDCKNYNEVGCANGFGWCERFNYGQTDEQFCSYGERKVNK